MKGEWELRGEFLAELMEKFLFLQEKQDKLSLEIEELLSSKEPISEVIRLFEKRAKQLIKEYKELLQQLELQQLEKKNQPKPKGQQWMCGSCGDIFLVDKNNPLTLKGAIDHLSEHLKLKPRLLH